MKNIRKILFKIIEFLRKKNKKEESKTRDLPKMVFKAFDDSRTFSGELYGVHQKKAILRGAFI